MATLTSTACQTLGGFFINPPKAVVKGVNARSAVYTFTANQSAGDVLQMVPIPKGAHIHDLMAFYNCPGGVQYTFGIGDGVDAKRYLLSASASGTAVARLTINTGYSYSVEDTIDITVQAVTSASAGGTIRLTVLYSMDQSGDGNS